MKKLLAGILTITMLCSVLSTFGIVTAEEPMPDPNNVVFDISPQLNNSTGWGAIGIGIFKNANTVIAEEDSIHKGPGNQMGADGGGWFIDVPAAETPLSYTRNGITYQLANYDEDKKNAFYVYGTDTVVDVPNKRYEKLGVLMVTGNQVLFKVNYEDGTDSTQLSGYNAADYKLTAGGWWNGSTDGGNVVTFSNRSYKDGANAQSGTVCAYALEIPVDSTKVVDSITVVDNHNGFSEENGGSQMYRFFKILAMSGLAVAEQEELTPPTISVSDITGVKTDASSVSVSATVTPNTATGEYTISGVTAKVDEGTEQALASGDENSYSGSVAVSDLTAGSHTVTVTATYGDGKTATANKPFDVAEAPAVNENNVIFDLSTQIDNQNDFGTIGIGIFNTEDGEINPSIHQGPGNQTGADGLGSLIVAPPAETPLTYTLNGITYKLANVDPDKKNAFFVHGADAVVDVPNKQYEKLGVILMGGKEVLFKVNYADGTDSTQLPGYDEANYKLTPGNWWNGPTDGGNVVTFANRIYSGSVQNGTACAYALEISVDSTKVVDSITVVDNLNASGNGMYRFFRILAMSGLAVAGPEELTPPTISVSDITGVKTDASSVSVSATVTPNTATGEYTISGVTAKVDEGEEQALTSGAENSYSGSVAVSGLTAGNHTVTVTATYGDGKTATATKSFEVAEAPAVNENNVIFDLSTQIDNQNTSGAIGVGIFNIEGRENGPEQNVSGYWNGANGGWCILSKPGIPLEYTVEGLTYKLVNTDYNKKNAFFPIGDVEIDIPDYKYEKLGALMLSGTGVEYVINYTDGSTSAVGPFDVPNWWYGPEQANVVKFDSRLDSTGKLYQGNVTAYAMELAVDSAKTVKSITLKDKEGQGEGQVNNYRVLRVLAMSGLKVAGQQEPEPDSLTPPTIALTSFPVSVETDDTSASITVTVTPNTATGEYTISGVTAKVDNGEEQALSAGTGNSYSGSVALGTLSEGMHDLTITATYGIGEITTFNHKFNVVAPSTGGGDIAEDNEKTVVVYTDDKWYTNGLSGSSYTKSAEGTTHDAWGAWRGTAGVKVFGDGYVNFEPNIKEAGTYDIYYFIKGMYDQGDAESHLKISVNGQESGTYTFNSQNGSLPDHWEKIGTYELPKGKGADKTVVTTTATTTQEENAKGYMAFANAVAFVPTGEEWPKVSYPIDTDLMRVGDKYFKQIDMSAAFNVDAFSGLDIHDADVGLGYGYSTVTKDAVDLSKNPQVIIQKSGVAGLVEYQVPFQFGSMERFALNAVNCKSYLNGKNATYYAAVEPRQYDKIHILFSGQTDGQTYTLKYQDGSSDSVSLSPDHLSGADGYGAWFNPTDSSKAVILFDGRVSPNNNDPEAPVEVQGGTSAIYMASLTPNPDKVLASIDFHGNTQITIYAVTGEVSKFMPDEDLQLSDQESVEFAKNNIDFSMIKGDNPDADNVIYDLNLITEGPNGTTVSWSSSAPANVATDGKVTPISVGPDTISVSRLYLEVTLTATIKKGTATATTDILVKVKPVSNVIFDISEQINKGPEANGGGISVFNVPGQAFGDAHTGTGGQKGADGGGYCLYAQPGITPLMYTVEGITYQLSNIDPAQRNAFFAVGDTVVTIPEAKYEKIGFLAVNGGDVKFTINYTDGTNSERITRNVANWWNGPKDPNVVTFPRRIDPSGSIVGGDWEVVTAYAVNIPADPTKAVKSITIADNRGVRILAMSGILADRQAAPTPPVIEVTSWPEMVGTWETTLPVTVSVTPNASAGDNAVTGVNARIDDSVLVDDLANTSGNMYGGDITLSGLTTGKHTLVITATDAEGEAAVYNYEFEVVNFSVDNIKYLSGSSEVESGVSGVNKVSLDINNYSGAAMDVKVIIASYKGNQMIDVVTSDESSVSNGQTLTVTKSIDTTGADRIKIFTWDSLVNMDSIWGVEGR